MTGEVDHWRINMTEALEGLQVLLKNRNGGLNYGLFGNKVLYDFDLF